MNLEHDREPIFTDEQFYHMDENGLTAQIREGLTVKHTFTPYAGSWITFSGAEIPDGLTMQVDADQINFVAQCIADELESRK